MNLFIQMQFTLSLVWPGTPSYMSAMPTLFSALIPVAVGVVFVVLAVGIFTMFRGGDVSRTWSNKMMRLRVVVQFAAILILVAALWLKDHPIR